MAVIHDEEFTNFREVKAGPHMASGILYRSSSPLKGGEAKKKAIGELAQKAGIKCIINLDNDYSVVEALAKEVPWYNKLLAKKKVIALNMNLTIPSADFNQKLKKGLEFMLANKGPYLIHCFAGVDRTGFVIAVLAGLMEGSFKEILDDYLLSFEDDSTPSFNGYYKRKKKEFLKQLIGIRLGSDRDEDDIMGGVFFYLMYDVGLSSEEPSKLQNSLLKLP